MCIYTYVHLHTYIHIRMWVIVAWYIETVMVDDVQLVVRLCMT